MNVKITALKLVDFRSFENEEILLDNITVVVGANNVGKSNILRALELFPQGVSIDLSRDLRRGSIKTSPELTYTIEFTQTQVDTRLDFQIPTKVLVRKTISDWTLLNEDGSPLESNLLEKEYYQNNTPVEVIVGEIALQPGKIIIGSRLDENLKQQLVVVSKENLNNLINLEIKELVKDLLPNVRNIWSPNGDSDFIAEDNPIDSLISTPTLPLTQLLAKAYQNCPSSGNYQVLLPKGIASETETFCQNVTESINLIFSENWNFNPPIKLKISARDSSLKVFFDQGRAGQLEPSFSSDGLIWLISFFVRLGMGEVENNIVLLDQPGDKLYPGGQKDLVRIIENLGEKNQLIYSTHSPFMITQKRLGRNIRIVYKETDVNRNQIGFSKVKNEIKQTDIRQSDLLTTALGFSWTDFVPIGDFNVLLEGKLDSAIVINTERQKAFRNGKADIDFSRVAIRGVGKASYINSEAKKIKIDGKKITGVFDSDWLDSTPDLENSEKIRLGDINSNWSDIEDLIPKDFFQNIFGELMAEYNIPFQYSKRLDGPGRGKKIKKYIVNKSKKLKGENDLINKVEIKLIELIEQISISKDELPESFYKLNSEIIKHLT